MTAPPAQIGAQLFCRAQIQLPSFGSAPPEVKMPQRRNAAAALPAPSFCAPSQPLPEAASQASRKWYAHCVFLQGNRLGSPAAALIFRARPELDPAGIA